MFTFRNVLAVGIFLFGTTFLWLTAAFNGGERSETGAIWKVIQALALAAIGGFALVPPLKQWVRSLLIPERQRRRQVS
jgi:hypothetical protein